MDSAILSALHMSGEERRARMAGLREVVLSNTVRDWKPGRLKLSTSARVPSAA
jgi:trehalose-6-phosphate synthase